MTFFFLGYWKENSDHLCAQFWFQLFDAIFGTQTFPWYTFVKPWYFHTGICWVFSWLWHSAWQNPSQLLLKTSFPTCFRCLDLSFRPFCFQYQMKYQRMQCVKASKNLQKQLCAALSWIHKGKPNKHSGKTFLKVFHISYCIWMNGRCCGRHNLLCTCTRMVISKGIFLLNRLYFVYFEQLHLF